MKVLLLILPLLANVGYEQRPAAYIAVSIASEFRGKIESFEVDENCEEWIISLPTYYSRHEVSLKINHALAKLYEIEQSEWVGGQSVLSVFDRPLYIRYIQAQRKIIIKYYKNEQIQT